MNVGSLFSGIGGNDLGLERAGMHVLWQAENDPYARAILARRFPGATLYSDVRTICAGRIAPVDVLVGGFPCQDISVAGKGAGIKGARSGLWREFARLVGELRPRYVIVENSPALRGRGLGTVLGDLSSRGYDAEWDCLPASAFGASHQRDRIWLVAYAHRAERGQEPEGRLLPDRAEGRRHEGSGGFGKRSQALADPDGYRQPQSQGIVSGIGRRLGNSGQSTMGDPDCAGLEERTIFGGDAREELAAFVGAGRWKAEPDVGRVADGVPSRVDRLRCLGNAACSPIPEFIGRRILAREGRLM